MSYALAVFFAITTSAASVRDAHGATTVPMDEISVSSNSKVEAA
jgi:hypothetical protein